MTAAIFGLLGVLVGGLITSVSNYHLAVRRDRADQRIHAIEVKRAARLIELELAVAHTVAKGIVEMGLFSDQPLSIESWQKWGPVLAPELSNADWDAVSLAIIAVERIEWFRARNAAGTEIDNDTPEGRMSEYRARTVANQLAAVKRGRDAVLLFI